MLDFFQKEAILLKTKKKKWWKQKTTWVGIFVILSQVAGIIAGEIQFQAGFAVIGTTAAGLISLVLSEKEGE